MLAIKQSLVGIARVVLACLLGAVVFAFITAAINWLRTYGLPIENLSVAQAPLIERSQSNPLIQYFGQIISAYNTLFTGYSRFGSWLGLTAGVFWAIGPAKSYVPFARVNVGLVAGFLAGARLVLNITSDAHLVILGGVIGALWTSVYLGIAGRPSRFTPLPELKLAGPAVE